MKKIIAATSLALALTLSPALAQQPSKQDDARLAICMAVDAEYPSVARGEIGSNKSVSTLAGQSFVGQATGPDAIYHEFQSFMRGEWDEQTCTALSKPGANPEYAGDEINLPTGALKAVLNADHANMISPIPPSP